MKFLFIVNPIAGRKGNSLDSSSISNAFSKTDHSFEVEFTTIDRRADAIVEERKEEFDVFVAVGGDGTINEVGKTIVGTKKIMGIIPNGSGNGLARTLGIPMDAVGAIDTIAKLNQSKIDAVKINGNYFFNVAGIGFDAYIARKFDKLKNRGLSGYINIIIKKFFFYKGKKFNIFINGIPHKERAFMISFANTSQFGNNAHIAPMAEYDDGNFDLCVIKNFPRWKTPELAIRLFNKTIHESKYYHHKSLRNLKIEKKGKIVAHLDGEPFIFKNQIIVEVDPKALLVISGNQK